MLPNFFQHVFAAMLAFGLLTITVGDAHAYCETATASGKRTNCGGSASSGGNGDNGAAAAAIGAGAGLIIEGLLGAANRPPSDEEIDRKVRKEMLDNNNRPASAKTKAAIRAAEADASLDPWGKKAPPKKTNDRSSTSGKKYVDATQCVTFKRPSGSLFDAVVNSCNAPIVVRWLDSGGCKTGCQTGVPASGQASITRIKGAGSFTACQGEYCSPKRG